MIADAREILYSAAADKDNGVFLQVMPDAGNI
jgi:hypothetical protein